MQGEPDQARHTRSNAANDREVTVVTNIARKREFTTTSFNDCWLPPNITFHIPVDF